jgi:hypothetical protein
MFGVLNQLPRYEISDVVDKHQTMYSDGDLIFAIFLKETGRKVRSKRCFLGVPADNNSMPEITTVTLNQLNALTRGSEVSATRSNTDANNTQAINNPAAKVLISQVSANTVTLTNPQNKQSVQLPAKVLANLGNIRAGQSFELISIANKANTYALISGAANRQSANLSQQSRLLASTTISVNDNQLNALVGKASANGDVSFGGKALINIAGRVTAISANQVTLSFTVAGSNLPAQQAQITLTQAQARSLSVNAKLVVTADISAQQAKIISLTSTSLQNNLNANKPTKIINLSSQLAQLNNAALSTKLISASILQQLSSSSPVIRSALNIPKNNALPSLHQAIIPLTDGKLPDLPKALLSSLQNAIAKVNTTAATQVSLVIDGTGNANTLKLSVLGNVSQSSVELNASQIRTLLTAVDAKTVGGNSLLDAARPLVANTQPGARLNANGADANTAGTGLGKASVASALSGTIAKQGFIGSRAQLGINQAGNPSLRNPASDLGGTNATTTAPNFKTNLLLEQLTKFISSTAQGSPSTKAHNSTILTQLLSQLPNTKPSSAIEQLTDTGATQKTNLASTIDALKAQVQALSKTTLAQSASQTQTLSNIIKALNAEADIAELSPETQTLLKNIREQLPSASTTQPTIDARAIRQLLGAPLNNAPLNAMSVVDASSFLSGLVTLLQVSLASKLQRQSNKQASKVQQQIPDIIKSIVPNIKSTQSAKLLQDFRQFDAKHTLSAEVAKMLFSHQNHKLNSIESALLGQDQLYYALPNIFNKNADDIELLVKRETRQNNSENTHEADSSWYLTMKLDIGPLGQMLAKTQLRNDEIKLQLYTSTTELKNKALAMLPYLQRRLTALGIELTEKSCQLGKIPKQLKSEHYQVFETQV